VPTSNMVGDASDHQHIPLFPWRGTDDSPPRRRPARVPFYKLRSRPRFWFVAASPARYSGRGSRRTHDRVGIAKNVFQVHGAKEKVVVRKQLRRGHVIAFFKALPRSSVRAGAASLAWRASPSLPSWLVDDTGSARLAISASRSRRIFANVLFRSTDPLPRTAGQEMSGHWPVVSTIRARHTPKP
jgi:hypothetical protein